MPRKRATGKRIRIVECSVVPKYTRFGGETRVYLTTLTPSQIKTRLKFPDAEISCHQVASISERALKALIEGEKDLILIHKVSLE